MKAYPVVWSVCRQNCPLLPRVSSLVSCVVNVLYNPLGSNDRALLYEDLAGVELDGPGLAARRRRWRRKEENFAS